MHAASLGKDVGQAGVEVREVGEGGSVGLGVFFAGGRGRAEEGEGVVGTAGGDASQPCLSRRAIQRLFSGY